MTPIAHENPLEAPHDMTAEANIAISQAQLVLGALRRLLPYHNSNAEVPAPTELPLGDEPQPDNLPHAS